MFQLFKDLMGLGDRAEPGERLDPLDRAYKALRLQRAVTWILFLSLFGCGMWWEASHTTAQNLNEKIRAEVEQQLATQNARIVEDILNSSKRIDRLEDRVDNLTDDGAAPRKKKRSSYE